MPNLKNCGCTPNDVCDHEHDFTMNDNKPGYWPVRLHWLALGVALFSNTSEVTILIGVVVWIVCFIYCLDQNYDL